MNAITPQDMMKLQTDNYNVFAEMMRPVLLKAINEEKLTAGESKYWALLKHWNLYNDAGEKGATVFDVVFQHLKAIVWNDELSAVKNHLVPYESTLLEGLLRDTAFQFVDNIHTPQKETLSDDVLAALQEALPELKSAEAQHRLEWSAYKDTHISHLLRLPAFSRMHITTGGGTYSINATKANHGPSWRMIVQLTPVTEAYGVFPGGQSGNPGSRFYANFIDSWAKGTYYPLLVLQESDVDNKYIKWKMTFSKN
jgi:penicillin amidase